MKRIAPVVRVLSAIGAYAVATKALQIFMVITRRARRPRATSYPEPGTEAFLDALSTALDTPVRRGGSVRILNNGDEFFPELLRALRSAERSIHIMTYIWKRSAVGDSIFDVLLEKARNGVEIRIMVDGIGGFFHPNEQFERLRQLGAQVAVYRPLLSVHFMHVDKRNHRRAFVIDGKEGFTGGMSISDDWAGHAQDKHHWRDTMVYGTGPVAHAIQAMFHQLWANVTGEQLVGPKYFPPQEHPGAEGPAHIGVAHSPSGEVQPLLHFYWFSLRAARRRIYLAAAYFAPDRYFRDLLQQKAREGVDVRLLLPGPHIDNVLVRWGAQNTYEEFLKAGVRVYEYAPTLIHAKQFVVDDRWVAVGSGDLGVRSVKLNQEGMLGIASEEVGRKMRETFERDFEESHEITLDEWRRRPRWVSARNAAAAILRAQY